jgi:hypothetical protein
VAMTSLMWDGSCMPCLLAGGDGSSVARRGP